MPNRNKSEASKTSEAEAGPCWNALLLDLLAPALVDALVIHQGDIVAICPLSPTVEKKLAALCRDEANKGVLPPGLAMIVPGTRAADVLAVLCKAGLSLDVECKNPGDAAELRHAMQAAVGDTTYVSEVRKLGGNN